MPCSNTHLSALTETILRTASHCLEVAHTTSAGGSATECLASPVVLSELGSRVTARGAQCLLDVEGHAAASAARRVRLGVALTKTLSTLTLHDKEAIV
jgi:hypothetical protein